MSKKTFYCALFTALLVVALAFIPNYTHSLSTLSDAKYLKSAVSIVQKEYLEHEDLNPRMMFEGALTEIQKKVPEILVELGNNYAAVTVNMASKRFSLNGLDSYSGLKSILGDILAFIDQNYSGDTQRSDMEYAAIDGLVNSLDPHSSFMPPKFYSEFKVGTKGEFGGLGIVISIKEGRLTVMSPLDGTPASKAGIKAGDHITQIDDESAINMSLNDAVNKLRGTVGTDVKLIIERPGRSSPMTFKLTRALINIDSVQHTIINENGKRIGYLKVKSFQSNTDDDLTTAFKDFDHTAKLDGLILDLRNNPGGLLNQAVALADRFLSKGTIVSTVGQSGRVLDRDLAYEDENDAAYPIAVLINEGSASASEIVAGAIKYLGRGIIIGRNSFGKGSVQTIFELSREAALKLTIAKYLPAGTYPIQSVGLAPDIDLVPAIIDKKEMDIVENETISEKSLERHLEESVTPEESVYHVSFLMPKETEEEMDAKEYKKTPVIKDDFAVNLAADILSRIKNSERKAMLAEIEPIIKEAGEQEQTKITGALKTAGIDWSRGETGENTELKVAFDILKNGIKQKEIRAGDESVLQIRATNTGKSPFLQLIGVTKSRMPLLMNREFVFGKLEPGKTLSSTVHIKMPGAFPSEEMAMEVKFEDLGKSVPTAINALIPVKGRAPPRFGITMTLDKNNSSNSKILNVDIVNVGDGSSDKDTVAQLINKSGENMFIEVGRAAIGKLAPGQSKRAVFRFHSADKIEEIKFGILVFDSMRFDVLDQKITYNAEEKKLYPQEKKLLVPPEIKISDAQNTTSSENWKLKGTISHPQGIADFMVFVNDKKVSYSVNAALSQQTEIDVLCPLKPGRNVITVAGRAKDGPFGRKVIAVTRTSGTPSDTFDRDLLPLVPETFE